jgi:hypothetical protein
VIETQGRLYCVHTFIQAGPETFNVLTASGLEVDVLLVGGGGGGGTSNANEGGGGGGGGGVIQGFGLLWPQGMVNVIVGAGGAGSLSTGRGQTGGASSLAFADVTLTARGGGGGGGGNGTSVGLSGGSGGGGSGWGGDRAGGAANQLVPNLDGVTGHAFAGGLGTWVSNASGRGFAGGGGGAGGPGEDGTSAFVANRRAIGGLPLLSSMSGEVLEYAAGGRGGRGQTQVNASPGAAAAGSGNGGDGAERFGNGGGGGSGVVMVRYAASRLSLQVPPPSVAQPGVLFQPPPVIALRDVAGIPLQQAGVGVSVAIATGSGQLLGTTMVETDAEGLASFVDLGIQAPAGVLTLVFEASGFGRALSAPILLPGATSAEFTAEPHVVVADGVAASMLSVQLRDAVGAAVAQESVSFTTTYGTLSAFTVLTDAAGVATVGLTSTAVGAAIIRAMVDGLGPVGDVSVDFVAGTASQLVFVTQPNTAMTGESIGAMTVEIVDANGHRVTDGVARVTLSLATNPGGAGLLGTRTLDAAEGLVSFSGLGLNRVGSGYTLVADAPGLTPANSEAFDITPKPLTIAGSFTAADKAFDGGVAASLVTAQLSLNGLVFGASQVGLDVRLAFSGPSVADDVEVSLQGTVLVGDDAGNYSLSLLNAPVARASIVPGDPSQLLVVREPVGGASGGLLQVQPLLEVQDFGGNRVRDGNVSVTVSLLSGVEGVLDGVLTVESVAGLASFVDLELSGRVETDYVLRFTFDGGVGVNSEPVRVVPGVATRLAFVNQPADAVVGGSLGVVSLEVLDSSGNRVVDGSFRVMLALSEGSTGALLGTLVVDSVGGLVSFPDVSVDRVGEGYSLVATVVAASPEPARRRGRGRSG